MEESQARVMSLLDQIRDIGQWHLDTFDDLSWSAQCAKLLEEVRELEAAHGDAAATEAADVIIVLAGMIARERWTLREPQCPGEPSLHFVVGAAVHLCAPSGWEKPQAHAQAILTELTCWCEGQRIDLSAAIDAKMTVNRARKWARQENGAIRHVKEG